MLWCLQIQVESLKTLLLLCVLLEYMAFKQEGVNCLKEIFENFWRFNETQWRNPEKEPS